MKNSLRIFHWFPRILGILAILFLSIFALDSFSPDLTLSQQLTGFIIHLIPSFVLLVFLIIAWKRELTGGLLFAILSLGFTPEIFLHNFRMNHSVPMSIGIVMMLNFPFFVTGVLFVLSHFLKKKNLSESMSA